MLARLPQSRLVFPCQLSSVYHKRLLQSTLSTPGIPVTHIRSSKSCRPSTPPSSPSSTYTSPTVQATMLKPPPLPPGYSKHHIVVLEGVHVAMPPFSIPHTIDVYPRTPSSQVLEPHQIRYHRHHLHRAHHTRPPSTPVPISNVSVSWPSA